jgi:hypothetical protein
MKVAKILKGVVIAEWALGLILGILSGISGGGISLLYSYSDSYLRGFSFLSAITIWVIFFLIGIFNYGFAVLLENVAAIRQRTEEQLYYLTGAVQQLGGIQKQNTAPQDEPIKAEQTARTPDSGQA